MLEDIKFIAVDPVMEMVANLNKRIFILTIIK